MILRETTSDGRAIIFRERQLEKAMANYLTLKHNIDESSRLKRKSGHYIYANDGDTEYMFLNWNFVNWQDAKFVVDLLGRKVLGLRKFGLFVKRQCNGLPPTKYEVEALNEDARKRIEKAFHY
jgi:hypothetical protein